MEGFAFCMEIIRREGEKFNVGVNTTTASQITAATAENINYDIAHNRCSYLYRCGAINLSFAKECFSKFFADYKSIVFLLSKWINCPNLTVCSLSKGPALDYIALLLSYQESGMFPSIFKNIKVISKYGAWRNTVNIMHEIVTEGYFFKTLRTPVSIGNIEVIQGDPFIDFSQKVKDPIFNSDIVIMQKALNLQADGCNQDKIIKSVQEFLAALKPDAILFCIDTKPSVALITKEISAFFGTYLLQSTFMSTSITLEHTDYYKDLLGCFPVATARGQFFVWQKSSPSTQNLSHVMDEVSESVKRLLRINNDISYSDKFPENNSDSDKLFISGSCPSTPTNFAKNCNGLFMSNEKLKSLAIESENNDQLSVVSANIATQNSKSFPSSSLLQNDILTCEYVEENILTKDVSRNCISVNKSIQTEAENNCKSAESKKIVALTERIANLTEMLNELLQTNELKDECSDDNCLRHMEVTCKCSASSSCIPGHCSSVASCCHKYQCESSENHMCSEEKTFENYCSNHMHKHGYLACNQYSSNDSLNNNHETTRYCNIPCHQLKFSVEKKSIPKLVIPLNNLPSDVVTQIISLISESNQEL